MSTKNQAVDPAKAMEAAWEISKLARCQDIPHALCGGLAMQLYGFTRATKDVDFIGESSLNLPVVRHLSFGGEVYQKSGIPIDWIIRSDEAENLYALALKASRNSRWAGGVIPIITPEWMVILKKLAGRGKDEMDVLWLLRQPKLVNRSALLKSLKAAFGKHAYWPIKDMEALFLEADLMKAKDEA